MNLHGKSLIADQLSTDTAGSFHAISPLDSSQLEPVFFHATETEVDQALRAAETAFESYRSVSGELRAQFLERIGAEIEALGDELINRAHLETGLPLARLVGERARTVGQLKLFAQTVREGSWVHARIDPAMPDRQPLPRADLRRLLIPLGPVIVFGSSNFPLAFSVAGGDTASALATGNPVVVKAHSAHPGTSELVATAVRKAVIACDLPPGVFSLLHGPGSVIGIALVRHPLARAVGFTGSQVAGRALFDAANARPDPIPVFAEMSSVNPVFILPHALRDHGAMIAEGLKNSITLGVGQFCTKPGLVFAVSDASLNAFEDKLTELIESVAPATMLHAGICAAYHETLERASGTVGVKRLGQSRATAELTKNHGSAVLARTDMANFKRQHVLHEEVFGPFALIVSAEHIGELETIARNLEGQLTATVHGTATDLAQAAALLKILERKAGRLIINGFPTGVEVSPAMNHGGPYPATTDVRFTSVGSTALNRFVRPVCYQDFPQELLPDALKDANPLGIWRLVNGTLGKQAVGDAQASKQAG